MPVTAYVTVMPLFTHFVEYTLIAVTFPLNFSIPMCRPHSTGDILVSPTLFSNSCDVDMLRKKGLYVK